MKKRITVTFFAIFLLGLLAIPLAAQGEGLIITEFSWRPETPYPGQDDLVMTVSYRNDGETIEFADGEALVAQVQFFFEDKPTGRPFTTAISTTIPAGAEDEIAVTVIAPTESKYEVQAHLLWQTTIDDKPVLTAIDTPNATTSALINVASALPAGVANLFAGLGMFAAIMAIIAVGTEVVIDSLRVALGMKSKVTAMQAYKKLNAQLPGQLTSLGVSADDIATFQRHAKQVGQVASQAESLAEVQKKLRDGQFASAFTDVLSQWDLDNGRYPLGDLTAIVQQAISKQMSEMALDPQAQQAIEASLADYIATQDWTNDDAPTAVGKLLKHLETKPPQDVKPEIINDLVAVQETITNSLLAIAAIRLQQVLRVTAVGQTRNLLQIANLPPKKIEEFAQLVGAQIDKINPQQLTMDNLLNGLALVFTQQGQQISLAWLEKQSQHLLITTKTRSLQLFDTELTPLLASFGLNSAPYREEFTDLMNVLDTKAHLEVNAHLDGLRNLLLAVEARRNDVQSPGRKLWRGIRNSSFPIWAVVLGPVPLLASLPYIFSLERLVAQLAAAFAFFSAGLVVAWAIQGVALYLGRRMILADENASLLSAILGPIPTILSIFIILQLDQQWLQLTVFLALFILGLLIAWGIQLLKFNQIENPHKISSDTSDDLRELKRGMLNPSMKQSRIMLKRAIVITDILQRPFTDNAQLKQIIKKVADTHEISETAVTRWYIYFMRNKQESMEDRLQQIADKPLRLPWWFQYGWFLFSLGDVFSWLETHWNFMLRRDNEMGQMSEAIKRQIESIDPTNLAAILQEREDHHRDEESSRVRWFRLISIVVGTVLALLLQIDAARLLDAVVPGISSQINIFAINMHDLWEWFPLGVILTPGIILTGFAASAGSAFWHDQLDRLQAAKKSSEKTAQIVKELQDG